MDLTSYFSSTFPSYLKCSETLFFFFSRSGYLDGAKPLGFMGIESVSLRGRCGLRCEQRPCRALFGTPTISSQLSSTLLMGSLNSSFYQGWC